MDPLAIFGGIGAILGIADCLHKLYKKLRDCKRLFPAAKQAFRLLSVEVQHYETIMRMACREVKDDEEELLSFADKQNLKDIIFQAEKLFNGISKFLIYGKDQFLTDAKAIYLVRKVKEIQLGRQWKVIRPNLDVFNWMISSSRMNLHLLIDVLHFRGLKSLLRRSSEREPGGTEKIRKIKEEL